MFYGMKGNMGEYISTDAVAPELLEKWKEKKKKKFFRNSL